MFVKTESLVTTLVLAFGFAQAYPSSNPSNLAPTVSKPRFAVGIPVEFGRTYSPEELETLGGNLPLTSRSEDKGTTPTRLLMPRASVDTLTMRGIWNCPTGGNIERSMTVRGTVSGHQNGGAQVAFTGVTNVDSWTENSVSINVLPDIVQSSARHDFCLTFGSTFCSYRITFPVEADVSSPTTVDLRGLNVQMREYCIGTSNKCGVFEVSPSQNCARTELEFT